MRKNKLFLSLTSVFLMLGLSVNAQQTGDAEKDSADLQARINSTLEIVSELSKMSSEQLDKRILRDFESEQNKAYNNDYQA